MIYTLAFALLLNVRVRTRLSVRMAHYYQNSCRISKKKLSPATANWTQKKTVFHTRTHPMGSCANETLWLKFSILASVYAIPSQIRAKSNWDSIGKNFFFGLVGPFLLIVPTTWYNHLSLVLSSTFFFRFVFLYFQKIERENCIFQMPAKSLF